MVNTLSKHEYVLFSFTSTPWLVILDALKLRVIRAKGYNEGGQMYAHVDGASNLYVRSCM